MMNHAAAALWIEGRRFPVIASSAAGALSLPIEATSKLFGALLLGKDGVMTAVDLEPVGQEPGLTLFDVEDSCVVDELLLEKTRQLVEFQIADLLAVQPKKICAFDQARDVLDRVVLETGHISEEIANHVSLVATSSAAVSVLERLALSRIGRVLALLYELIFRQIYTHLKNEHADLGELVRHECDAYFFSSAFLERAFSKPLGYAGDFETMNLIHEDTDDGDDLFSRLIQRATMSVHLCEAMRHRSELLFRTMRAEIQRKRRSRFRIASICCGCAQELVRLLWSLDRPSCQGLEISVHDSDGSALFHATRHLERVIEQRGIDVAVNPRCCDLRSLLRTGLDDAGPYDFVYSANMYDYAEQRSARAITRRLAQGLRKGGVLAATAVSDVNPSRWFLKLVTDWELLHRDRSALANLFVDCDAAAKIAADPLGIHLTYFARIN